MNAKSGSAATAATTQHKIHFRTTVRAVLISLVLATTSAVAGQTQYKLVPIQPLSIKNQISPNCMNNHCEVVGNAFNVPNWEDSVEFIWSPRGTFASQASQGQTARLPGISDENLISGWHINDRHEVVGQSWFPDYYGISTPWYWKPGLKAALPLQQLPGQTQSSASSITEAGLIVGQSGNAAVIWDSPNAAPKALPTFDGTLGAGASAANNLQRPTIAGTDLVFYGPEYYNYTFHAVLWSDPTQPPQALPMPDRWVGAVAVGINDAGKVVGNGSPIEWWLTHAAVWENGVAIDLTPDASFACVGNPGSINNRGQIVGTYEVGPDETHAVLWQKNGGQYEMIDLNDVLAEPTPYTLTFAYEINDIGCIIVDAYDLSLPQEEQVNYAYLLVPTD